MVLIPADFAQCSFNFTGSGLPNGATATIGLDVSLVAGGPDDVADQMQDAFTESIILELTDDVQLTSVLVKYGPTATGPTGTWSGSFAGGYGTNSLPPNCTYLARKQTAFGGRSGRGRWYLPGVAEASVNDAGQVQGSSVTAMQGRLDAFVGKVEANDIGLVLLHDAGAPLTIPTPITRLLADSRIATQRRRLRR